MANVVFGGELASVSRGRLADEVADHLAAALMAGDIAPGDTLPSEASISERFGVSKPIAREALRALAAAGLVQTQHGKLTRARGLTGVGFNRIFGWAIRANPARLKEANQLRLAIETGVASIAAEVRNESGLKAIEAALEQMRRFLRSGEGTFVVADVAFHQAIALATGNELIRVQIEGMEVIQRGVSEVFSGRGRRTAKDWEETIGRHEVIAVAILEGEPERAEAAMRAHFAAADLAAIQLGARTGADKAW